MRESLILTEMDEMILDARLSGLSMCELDEKNLRVAVDQIMLRGAAISGCPLPNTDFFAGFIASELTIFINNFGYGELTVEEILLSIRLNAKGIYKHPSGEEVERIEFYGHCFNVNFMAKVLDNYMIFRNYFEKKLKNHIDGY